MIGSRSVVPEYFGSIASYEQRTVIVKGTDYLLFIFLRHIDLKMLGSISVSVSGGFLQVVRQQYFPELSP